MVFSSLEFIFLFMPIFFGCYYLAPRFMLNIILLIGSLSFYFIGTIHNPEHFILFVISMLVDYKIGILIEKNAKNKKFFLLIGIIFHVICLSIFKYLNFITAEVGKIINDTNVSTNIILPIGISFYTFQGLSYIVDVYRGKVKAEKSLLRFTVYISMFEQLIAGPIVTYVQVKKELYDRKINKQKIINGICIFVFGLGLKVLLANPLGKLWSQTCSIGFESISTPLAWIAIIGYSLQIYFDFFGYSLMAIGLGKMLGFNLPKNFNHPYLSKTMSEFWRRWHMTLGTWFKEYVYIPLGGNRKGKLITIRNLFLVWLLTGIWHGAGYNFLLWGFIIFLIMIFEKFVIKDYFNKHPLCGHLYMIILIPITWAIFSIEDINQLGIFLQRLFPIFGNGIWSIFRYDYLKYLKIYYPFLIVGILFSTKFPYRILKKLNKRIVYILIFIIFSASLYCMYRGLDDPFLYFRF